MGGGPKALRRERARRASGWRRRRSRAGRLAARATRSRSAAALARDPEPAADVLQGVRLLAAEPVAELEDTPVALGQRVESAVERFLLQTTSVSSSGSGSSPATRSPKTASSCSPIGWSRLVEARAAARTSIACWSGRPASCAISSSVGSRASCVQRWRSARCIF